MAKLTDPKKRERHLRIFRMKVTNSTSEAHLEKLLRKLWDRWTWDTGDDLEKDKIKIIEDELAWRRGKQGKDWMWFQSQERIKKMRSGKKGFSLRKKRKRKRDAESKLNLAWQRINSRHQSKV